MATIVNPENVVNLTQHELRIVSGDDVYIVEPSGTVARVKAEYEPMPPARQLLNVQFVTRTFGDIEGLPEPDGRLFIVSGFVLAALEAKNGLRMDVVAPDTGPTAIRDDNGRIQAVTRLIYPNYRD